MFSCLDLCFCNIIILVFLRLISNSLLNAMLFASKKGSEVLFQIVLVVHLYKS